MTRIIKIPGRLESAETGNIVTGAKDILDDAKGKKQNVINSEVDAELERLDQSKQALSDAIEAILLLIPSAASALNQLADKGFVNSSISTATATPRGTYNLVSDLDLTTDATRDAIAEKLGEVIDVADLNDYAFVQVPVSDDDPTEIERTERYKFNGDAWIYEYTLNTSGFTAAQWEAINSGITAALVAKLDGLPTAAALELALGTITQNIQNISAVIPTEATALNQLADKAYVLAQILAATPSFKGQFTTLAQLQDVTGAKAGDLGIVRTKDSDGHDVFTFYQYLDDLWNEYFVLSYHPQDKPATTGWLGNYPYNGMGRVELPKNMVDGWPDNTWVYLPKNDVVYLLYSWRLQLYAVYNSDTQEGLGLDDNLVIKPANYDIADLEEIVDGHYLPFTEDNGVWTITKPDDSTITSTELNNTNIYHYNDPSHKGINVLTPVMLNRPNTIYVILHDFDLGGATITIPANCVLEFEGGSLSNGTLVGSNTGIEAVLTKIFSTDITLSGTWNVAEAYPEWFGAKGDGVTDDRIAIQKALDSFTKIKFRGTTYLISVNDGTGLAISSIKFLQGVGSSNSVYGGDIGYTELLIANADDNATGLRIVGECVVLKDMVISGVNTKKGFGIKHYRQGGEFASKLTMEDCIVRNFDTGVAASSFLNLFTRLRCISCTTGMLVNRIDETINAHGLITSNCFRLCSFAHNGTGLILNGIYQSLANCTFDENTIGFVNESNTITCNTISFESNHQALISYGKNSKFYGVYIYSETSRWTDYEDAKKFINIVSGFYTIIEGLSINLKYDNPNIVANDPNFSLIYCEFINQAFATLLTLSGVFGFRSEYIVKTASNVRSGDVIISTNRYGGSFNDITNITPVQKVFVDRFDLTNKNKCFWDGEDWRYMRSFKMNKTEELASKSIQLNNTDYYEICEGNVSNTNGATFIMTKMFGYTFLSRVKQPLCIVGFDSDTYTVSFNFPYEQDYYNSSFEIKQYTKPNGKIGLAIKGHKDSKTAQISILNNRTNNGDDVLDFTLSQVDLGDDTVMTNIVDIIPIFLNGGSGSTLGRPTFLKQVGFPYYDTTLKKPIWWDGSDWLVADGKNANLLPYQDSNLASIYKRFTNNNYIEVCEIATGLLQSAAFMITSLFGYDGDAQNNCPVVYVRFDCNIYSLYITNPIGKDYNNNIPDFISYTKDNGKIGFAIKSHRDCKTANIIIISNKRSENGDDLFNFTMTDISQEQEAALVNKVHLIPNYYIGSTGNSNRRYSQLKNVGFRHYNTSANKPEFWNGEDWVEADGIKADTNRSGNSSSRPIGSSINIGFQYFDTTLGKPIYASAISGDTVTWVDASGATV